MPNWKKEAYNARIPDGAKKLPIVSTENDEEQLLAVIEDCFFKAITFDGTEAEDQLRLAKWLSEFERLRKKTRIIDKLS